MFSGLTKLGKRSSQEGMALSPTPAIALCTRVPHEHCASGSGAENGRMAPYMPAEQQNGWHADTSNMQIYFIQRAQTTYATGKHRDFITRLCPPRAQTRGTITHRTHRIEIFVLRKSLWLLPQNPGENFAAEEIWRPKAFVLQACEQNCNRALQMAHGVHRAMKR